MLDLQLDYTTMLEQLHVFCEINSGTNNLPGLALMHEKLLHAFKPIGDVIKSYEMPLISTLSMTGESLAHECGSTLVIRKRPDLQRRVLLCGHMDTVYAASHPFQTLTQMTQNILNGPGVADMKGGLIVMLHALEAFERMPNAHLLGWDVVINADEEIGSCASSALMAKVASHCQAALVYEPAMTIEGTLARNRKGNAKITLVATGFAAHAGRDFNAGRNAICYLAEVITSVHALNGLREGVTLNVGKISGGSALNTVAEKAVAKVDVRFTEPRDELWVRAALDALHQQHEKIGYTLQIDVHFNRPVKRVNEATEHLFSRIASLGSQLGITLDWQDSGGCCDGNNLAQHGLAVLDTLGVRGGNIHTPDEFIALDSLVERATLSALLLNDLAQGQLEVINA